MKLTVGQYQEFERLRSVDMDELDRETIMVSIATGKTVEQVEKMPVYKFNKLCRKIHDAFEIEINSTPVYLRSGGKLYKVNYDCYKTTGRYVEISHYQDDFFNNMHKVLASCVVPCAWYGKTLPYNPDDHGRYAEDMLNVEFKKAYAVGVFFYNLLANSLKDFGPEIKKEMKCKAGEKFVEDLLSILDGLAPRKRLLRSKGLAFQRFGK
jgi:hypothetical protein